MLNGLNLISKEELSAFKKVKLIRKIILLAIVKFMKSSIAKLSKVVSRLELNFLIINFKLIQAYKNFASMVNKLL